MKIDIDSCEEFKNSLQKYSYISDVTQSQNEHYNKFKNILQKHLHIEDNNIILDDNLNSYKTIIKKKDITNILIIECNKIIEMISKLKINIDKIMAEIPQNK